MRKVLIANHDIDQNKQLCQYLTNDKRFEITETTDGKSTLNKYLEIKPNVLILDTNFKDMNCIEIINRLSMTIEEKRNCNTILVVDKSNENIKITNMAKVYKVIEYSDLDDLFNTINEICSYSEYEELTEFDIDKLFLKLKIKLNSNGADYLRESITQCYYYPNLLKKLDDIFFMLAKKHDKTNDAIRSSFRSALEPLNNFRDTIDYPIMKYFDYGCKITPQRFLEIVVMYLHIIKNKK